MGRKGTSPWLCAHTTDHHRPSLSPRDTPSSWRGRSQQQGTQLWKSFYPALLTPRHTGKATGTENRSVLPGTGESGDRGAAAREQDRTVPSSDLPRNSPHPSPAFQGKQDQRGRAVALRSHSEAEPGPLAQRSQPQAPRGCVRRGAACLLSDSPRGRTRGSRAF